MVVEPVTAAGAERLTCGAGAGCGSSERPPATHPWPEMAPVVATATARALANTTRLQKMTMRPRRSARTDPSYVTEQRCSERGLCGS